MVIKLNRAVDLVRNQEYLRPPLLSRLALSDQLHRMRLKLIAHLRKNLLR